MAEMATCNCCGQMIQVVHGRMSQHGSPITSRPHYETRWGLCPGSQSRNFTRNIRPIKVWQHSHTTPRPAAGQVWRDLNSPGRTLTINFLFQNEAGVWYAQCTSYNPNVRGNWRRRTRITRIRASRFHTKRIWVQRGYEGFYRTVGYQHLEMVSIWVINAAGGGGGSGR